MNDLTEADVKPLVDSIYVKPVTMHFILDGVQKKFDLLDVHDDISIIIYNITRNALVFVKQFRPSVYFSKIPIEDRNRINTKKYPADLGITLELCSGLVDKDLPLNKIASEEVLEECGYDVPVKSLEEITSFRYGGESSSLTTFYYCEVNDDMKVSAGGGIEDEVIEVVEMTIPEVKKYISQDNVSSPPCVLFGISWFLANKVQCSGDISGKNM